MNVEEALLAEVIESGDFRALVKARISADFFFDTNYREVFLFLREQFDKHSTLPSHSIIQSEFPEVPLVRSGDAVPVLAERVRAARVYSEISTGLEEITQEALSDPLRAASTLTRVSSRVQALAAHSGADMDLTACTAEVLSDYDRNKKHAVTGIAWPWEPMNKATRGIQPGELWFVYGLPKTMKSWVLLNCAHHAHAESGKRVVFASQEMTYRTILSRAVALFCKLDYRAYKEGRLTHRAEREFRENVQAFEETEPYVVTKLEQRGVDAVYEFEQKLLDYQADIGFFDAVYLTGDGWEELRAVTARLKQISNNLGIPILGTCQENAHGSTAYSGSFVQDCDGLIRTKRTPDDRAAKQLRLLLPALRETEMDGFTINAIPATDFSLKYFDVTEDAKYRENEKKEFGE